MSLDGNCGKSGQTNLIFFAWCCLLMCFCVCLNKAQFWRGAVFRGAPVYLYVTKVPVAACLRRMRLTVARVKPTRPIISLCRMPSWACGSTACLIPIRVRCDIIRTISENWEKNMQLLIQTCHNAKADLGKWQPKLRFWTLAITLSIEVKDRPRKGRISLGSSHRYTSCHFQPTNFDPYRFYYLQS